MIDISKCSEYNGFLQDKIDFKGIRKNTIEKYNDNIIPFYEYFSEKLKINNEVELLKTIDSDGVREYVRYLINKCYSCATINNKITMLKEFFKYLATARHLINYSPFDVVGMVNEKVVKTKKKNIEVLTKDEYFKVLKQVDIPQETDRCFGFTHLRNKFLIMFTFSTGVRCDEILNAEMSWLEPIENGYMINIPKDKVKNDLDKRLPITGEVYKVFKEYINVREDIGIVNNYLIVSSRGKKLTIQAYNNYLNKIIELTGINKHISSHCGRHFFSTIAKEIGIDSMMVKRIGGWSVRDMAENYCSDVALDGQKIIVCNKIIA